MRILQTIFLPGRVVAVKVTFALGTLLTAIAAANPALAASRFDVYFLAVGSSNYVTPSNPQVHGFTRIPGANQSARLVADRLMTGGARYGLVLTSGENTYVSLSDIQAALNTVSGKIAKYNSSPLLIFYFAGHGMAEGVGWNHFSIPGDMSYTGDPRQLDLETLAHHALHAGALADALDKFHIPYLVMLDTCSEGRPAQFDSPVLTPQASGGFTAVTAALRVLNEFRQESPVIFSSAPGGVVQVVQDPTDPTGERIGPMARRLVLLLDSAAKSGNPMSMGAVIRGLTSASLDLATQPAVTHATSGSSWTSILFQPGAATGHLAQTTGSAHSANLCCNPATATGPPPTPMLGSVTIRGESGEFITSGRRFAFTAPPTAVSLTESAGDIVIQVAVGTIDT